MLVVRGGCAASERCDEGVCEEFGRCDEGVCEEFECCDEGSCARVRLCDSCSSAGRAQASRVVRIGIVRYCEQFAVAAVRTSEGLCHRFEFDVVGFVRTVLRVCASSVPRLCVVRTCARGLCDVVRRAAWAVARVRCDEGGASVPEVGCW